MKKEKSGSCRRREREEERIEEYLKASRERERKEQYVYRQTATPFHVFHDPIAVPRPRLEGKKKRK